MDNKFIKINVIVMDKIVNAPNFIYQIEVVNIRM